jgi:hypothetical protein
MNYDRIFNALLIAVIPLAIMGRLVTDLGLSIGPPLLIGCLAYMAVILAVRLAIAALERLGLIPKSTAEKKKPQTTAFEPPPPEATAIVQSLGPENPPLARVPLPRPPQRPRTVPSIRLSPRRDEPSHVLWPHPEFTLKGGDIPAKGREGPASWKVGDDRRK